MHCSNADLKAVLQAVELSSFGRIHAQTVTAKDYSVWLTGLPRNDCENCNLIELARHYGEVVTAFHIPLLGKPLSGCRKVRTPVLLLSI